MTPITSTTQWQDLNQECLPTKRMCWSHNTIWTKYVRYLQLLTGEVGYSNQLRDFLAKLMAALKML